MPQTVRDKLQTQIDQLTREILDATEKAWEAQKANQLKQNTFWLDEKRKLTEERTELQRKLHLAPAEEDSIKPQTRQEIKAKIIHLNNQAKLADKNMRRALENKELSQANRYLRQRNQFNAEVKNLNKLLHPANQTLTEANAQKKEEKPLTRQQIKEKIQDYNKRAVEADTQMRISLREKKLEKANELLQQRNYLNVEAKKLSEKLQSFSASAENNTVSSETNKKKILNIIPSQQLSAQPKQKTNHLIDTDQPLSREEIKQNIIANNAKARKADKEMRIALDEKRLLDANELLQHRNRFNNESKRLLRLLQTPVVDKQQKNTGVAEKTLNRGELKSKLLAANKQALDADHAMRAALAEKKYQKANEYLKQRNIFNSEAKKISLLLNPLHQNTSNTSQTPPPTHKEATKIETDTENTNKNSTKVSKDNNSSTAPTDKFPQGFGLSETSSSSDKPAQIQAFLSAESNQIDQESTDFSLQIAQKIINYRLGFIKFFYKKRDLKAQINAEKSMLTGKATSNVIDNLEMELKEHLKNPPKAYVEDHAHNEIILHLLDKVDERGVAYFNFPEITATTIGAPLKQIKSHQDLTDFIQRYTEEEPDSKSGKRVLLKYFIRDIMQVKCPVTICDLILHDAIMDTATTEYGFVNLFNKIVKQANQELIRLQDESDDPLMPKVLRPIGSFDCVGHRDAIQLIPPVYNGLDQFSGAILSDTTIQDNVISSSAKLQGIFSTDGAFRNLKIINNKINTEGEHKIAILGMLSGEISGNSDADGNELEVKIQPLRLGGGTPLTNFFILGFAEGCSYQYEHIEGISGTKNDCRSKKVVRGHKAYDQRKYLIDFNMDRFIEHYQCHAKPRGRFNAIKDCIDRMLKEGDAVKCNAASLDALENGASLKEATEIARPTPKKEKQFVQNPALLIHQQSFK